LNALGLVSVVSFLLSIIYVISTTAFNAIISLQTISLSVSYIPPILFFMLRKIRGQHIPYGPFKLGRYGIATNVLALAYLLYVVIWMPFPTMLPVTGSNMNYAGPLLGTVIIGALVDWTFSGHKRFKVPVAQSWTM
jgi:choline transport protein